MASLGSDQLLDKETKEHQSELILSSTLQVLRFLERAEIIGKAGKAWLLVTTLFT